MFASPLLAGLVLMVDPTARNIDFSGGAVVELRGGSAPLVIGGTREPALRLTVAPDATFIYQSRMRGRQLVLTYSPQFYSRISREYYANTDVRRPLVFQSLQSAYRADLTPVWDWQAALAGGLGEQDYSLQTQQLGGAADGAGTDGQQSSLIGNPIITTGSASGGLGFNGNVHPLHTVTIAPSFTMQRLLSDPPVDSVTMLPVSVALNQTSGDLSLSHGWTASRVDSLTTSATGGYADFGANGSQAYASLNSAWRRRLRPRLDNELGVGVFLTAQIVEPESNNNNAGGASGRIPALPTVSYLLQGRLLQRARFRISGDVNVGTQAYFDPVQGSVLPLAGGGLALNAFFPPDWTAGVNAGFYTPPTPPGDLDRQTATNEDGVMVTTFTPRTTLSVRTPVSYDLSRTYKIEFGT
ncbi:MAG: hypothetical protein K0V04_02555, partial [Deltaproteobacteria bacterium]|nr:hypothetical protein [Deltaproteobacteria bacterium]